MPGEVGNEPFIDIMPDSHRFEEANGEEPKLMVLEDVLGVFALVELGHLVYKGCKADERRRVVLATKSGGVLGILCQRIEQHSCINIGGSNDRGRTQRLTELEGWKARGGRGERLR